MRNIVVSIKTAATAAKPGGANVGHLYESTLDKINSLINLQRANLPDLDVFRRWSGRLIQKSVVDAAFKRELEKKLDSYSNFLDEGKKLYRDTSEAMAKLNK